MPRREGRRASSRRRVVEPPIAGCIALEEGCPMKPGQAALPSVSHTPLPKVPTGITGFDEITCGGLPRGRTTLVRGGPGCGKTVFALQSC